MFRAFVVSVVLAIMGAGSAVAQEPTLLHIINVKWKKKAKPQEIQAALEFLRDVPSKKAGVRRVWLTNVKYQAQENYNQVVVMELDSPFALEVWGSSSVREQWLKLYLPILESSRTHDVIP